MPTRDGYKEFRIDQLRSFPSDTSREFGGREKEERVERRGRVEQALLAVIRGDNSGRRDDADPATLVFGLSASQIGRRVKAAANAAKLGEAFTGHSGRVGRARALTAVRAVLPALIKADWSSPPGCDWLHRGPDRAPERVGQIPQGVGA